MRSSASFLTLLAALGCAAPRSRAPAPIPSRAFDAIGCYEGGSGLEAIAPGDGGELWLFASGAEPQSVYAIAVDPVATTDGWTLRLRSPSQAPVAQFSARVQAVGSTRTLITDRSGVATRATLERRPARFDRTVLLESEQLGTGSGPTAPPITMRGPLFTAGGPDDCKLAILTPARRSETKSGRFVTSVRRLIGDHWGDAKSPCAMRDLPIAAPIKVSGHFNDAVVAADDAGIAAVVLVGYMSVAGYIRPDIRRDPAQRAELLIALESALSSTH